MDAVERGNAFIFQIVGDALVRREHEFFDQAVGDVALGARNALHHAKFVELDDGFRKVEVNRSSPLAFAIEDHREIMHAVEVVDLICVFDERGRILFDYCVYRRVGHAIGGADHAFVHFVADDFALMIDLHGAGKNQSIDFWAQAADVRREFEWQHRDGAVGEVDAGASQAGFLVERGLGRYVLCDIRDVDLQFVVSVFEFAHMHGVVEIAGGFSVDRDDREIAVVAAIP